MNLSKSTFMKSALVAAVAAGALAASATTASAYVACNRFGECWHTWQQYNGYPGNVGVTFHDDNWWSTHRDDRHWRWRDHDRGYYRNGVWVGFHF